MYKIISNKNIKDFSLLENKSIVWDLFDHKKSNRFLYVLNLFVKSFNYDAIVLNCGGNDLLCLCFLKLIMPFYKTKIIALEWNGVKPIRKAEIILTIIKKFLLMQVDYFLLLIVDISSFNKYFGINKKKCRYLPFKINQFQVISKVKSFDCNYILTCGNRRDYDLVANAVKELHYSVVMLCPPDSHIVTQGTRIPSNESLSRNVKLIKHDGYYNSWIKYISECKFIVIPVSDVCIYAEGVSTYLEAMILKKCVITTSFEGTRGIIDNGQAVLVPRGDVISLRNAIVEIWENDDVREKYARKGYEYAISLGGDNIYDINIVNFVREYLDSTKTIKLETE